MPDRSRVILVLALVPETANGQDEHGLSRIVLDLFPQTPDMHVHGAGFYKAVLTPHLVQEV
jgi:hypothetical protein